MSHIEYDPSHQVWLLGTATTSYAIRLTPEGRLLNLYWGPRLHLADAAHLAGLDGAQRRRTAEQPIDGIEEYPVEGGTRYGPPALSVRFPDGVRSVEWEFDGHEIVTAGNSSELELRFTDPHYPLALTLEYRIFEDGDVIERRVEIRNTGEGELLLRKAYSAAWTIPFRADYRLSRLHGRWGGETRLERVPLSPSATLLSGSRTGTTSHLANPWFAVDDGTAGEEHGEVWSGALAWSGTWEFAAHRFPNGRTQISGGFGHPDFDVWTLGGGEMLTTPTFAGLYSAHGFGAVSREWHAYLLHHVLPRATETRPVLYNSWEATFFDIDVQNQIEIARVAAELGCELFVMDDGWFGGRVNDQAGLGDWWPNPDRFPDGLTPLIDEVEALGMAFGIWVEPEMVNPDSDLYREHPDWVYHFPNRKRSEFRNQLVLNFARTDVRAWAYEWLDRLLGDHNIAYVKWDMNRPFSEAGHPGAEHPEHLWVEHVRGVYGILDRLRAAHPGVAFETCAGGGGRADFGIFARTDMAWTSDNTDGLDRLIIQDGFTQVYAPRVMSAWVTDSPDHIDGRRSPLRWRFHVAMAGLLGVGGNLPEWSPEERAEAKELIALYKRIRPVVQHGLLYRLEPPVPEERSGRSAVQYVARDGTESVVLAYLHSRRFGAIDPPLRLRGLDPATRYRNAETGEVWTGALLRDHGVHVPLRGDFDSALLHFIRETD